MTCNAARRDGGAGGWSAASRGVSSRLATKVREDRPAQPVIGERVGVGALDAADQPFESQPSQVISHLCAGVGAAEQSAALGAKAPVGKAGDGVDDHTQGAGQGHDAGVRQAQGSGSPALLYRGL